MWDRNLGSYVWCGTGRQLVTLADIKQIMNDAMQDGLILFEEYLQSSIDTRIADQLQAGEASDKLLYAAELWRAAADMAALEG